MSEENSEYILGLSKCYLWRYFYCRIKASRKWFALASSLCSASFATYICAVLPVVQSVSGASLCAFAQHQQQQQSNLGSIVSSSPVTPTTIQPLLLPAQHTEQHSSPSFHLQDKEQRKCRSVGLCVHVQLPPPRQETNDEENDSIVQYTENTQRKNSAVVGSVHVKITIIKTSLSASSVQKYLLIF